ncbi:hypothetical protein SAMN04488028_101238 [Reichenbachiella agariperforans]|uniref:SatD family (SatD) n=1 Tax=Reichenbachiella agariperforans TaxID=156994 RepID=A0A1M6JLI5_REIAG|nr:transcriptional regulator [Reichenbachiella agariperforans]SHJ47565.1 hypothetical protein SAMN04488028_101238 [Reichenbachiella agariperforans]
MKSTKAVITGDIINSRAGDASEWLIPLKSALTHYGRSPQQWEIYRGDSFQLILPPEQALLAAIHIKASVRQSKAHDVRMAIGLGDQDHTADKITESNGTAFVRSGECFESLKKQTLAIRSSHDVLNEPINLMLSLALLTANHWSATVAGVVTTVLTHTDKNQIEIAERLGKSQSSVSEALKRGGFEEIMQLNAYYQSKLSQL